MKNIVVIQNLAACEIIEKAIEIKPEVDTIIYNPAAPGLSQYLLRRYASNHLIKIPTTSEIKKFSKEIIYLGGEKDFSSEGLRFTAEVKRNYINLKASLQTLNWFVKNVDLRGGLFNLVCYNRNCIVPFAIKEISIFKGYNLGLITEVELDNSSKNSYKVSIYSPDTSFNDEHYERSFTHIRRLNSLSDVMTIVLSWITLRRTVVTPSPLYTIDRALAMLFFKLFSQNRLRKNTGSLKIKDDLDRFFSGFICQISDDTSMRLSKQDYFNKVETWLAEEESKQQTKILFIHPKERSIQSLWRYFLLSKKYSSRIFFGGLDLFLSDRPEGNEQKIKLSFITSSTFEKYNSRQDIEWVMV